MQQLQLMMFLLLSFFDTDGARQKMENKTEIALKVLTLYVIHFILVLKLMFISIMD